MKNHKKQKGFTLIELLVVIAIIAILAVVVVLTLNPAELLRQARDSNRISDFATLKSALALYSIDVATTTSMDGRAASGVLFSANASLPSSSFSVYTSTSSGSWGFVEASSGPSINASRAVDGTGWIPVDLGAIDSGAPLNVYPVDPVNSGTSSAYIYEANFTSWKIATNMESAKYSSGPNNVLSTDGGNSDYVYEQGSNLAL